MTVVDYEHSNFSDWWYWLIIHRATFLDNVSWQQWDEGLFGPYITISITFYKEIMDISIKQLFKIIPCMKNVNQKCPLSILTWGVIWMQNDFLIQLKVKHHLHHIILVHTHNVLSNNKHWKVWFAVIFLVTTTVWLSIGNHFAFWRVFLLNRSDDHIHYSIGCCYLVRFATYHPYVYLWSFLLLQITIMSQGRQCRQLLTTGSSLRMLYSQGTCTEQGNSLLYC